MVSETGTTQAIQKYTSLIQMIKSPLHTLHKNKRSGNLHNCNQWNDNKKLQL